jgi:menaquinone-9 beta-reductase
MRARHREIALADAARTWDAVVIGAGPAGSVAAYELARRGAHVLLVEKQRLGRDKPCGGCLSARAGALLQEAGLGAAVRPTLAAPLDRFTLAWGRRCVTLPLPTGWAVDRTTFDAALARAAGAAGAALLTGTTATVGDSDASTRAVMLADDDATRVVRARAVIVADGLGGRALRECPEFRMRVARAPRIGAHARLPLTGDYAPGTIHMVCDATGYVGLVQHPGGLHVALACDPAAVRAAGGVGAVAAKILGAADRDAPALSGARWHGTSTFPRHRSAVAATRVFVVGDAARYVEPFTGEGLTWALRTGAAVAPFALACGAAWRDHFARGWVRRYQQCVARDQRRCGLLTRGLRHPALAHTALRLLARWPALATPWLRGLAPR